MIFARMLVPNPPFKEGFTAVKKEKHPVYRLVMAGLILLLALGVALLVMGLNLGGDRLILPGKTAI